MAKKGILSILFAILMIILMTGNVYAEKCGGSCGNCNDTCETKAVKDWTVLVFLNADNDLDQYGVIDVNEMEKIGSNDQMNVVVLLDRQYGTAQKLYITKDNDENNITSKVVEELGDYDMGSYKNLVDFVAWGVKNYPAKHYVVDIWNHGSGWWKKGPALKGISYDDQSGNHITIPQLGEAMASIYQILGKKLDILAMDACLMQMAEVCYEFKDYVHFCVASEDSEPCDGYTYDNFLDTLVKDPSMDASTLAKVLAQTYAEHYIAKNEACTQSVMDVTQLDAFIAKLDQLCAKLNTLMSEKAFVGAIRNQIRPKCQSFYLRTNIDLGDFLGLVQTNFENVEVQALASEALALYGSCQNPLITGNYINGRSMQNATGLAIHFHSTIIPGKDYETLKFAQKTNWLPFLKTYIPASTSYDWYEKR